MCGEHHATTQTHACMSPLSHTHYTHKIAIYKSVSNYSYYIIAIIVCIFQVSYIIDRKEQKRIVIACHEDPTSGHMGTKRTLARITERFIWPGVTKDVQELVSLYIFHIIVNSLFKIILNCLTSNSFRFTVVIHVRGSTQR